MMWWIQIVLNAIAAFGIWNNSRNVSKHEGQHLDWQQEVMDAIKDVATAEKVSTILTNANGSQPTTPAEK